MEPITTIQAALAITANRLATAPDFPLYQSINAQLLYLHGVINGTEQDHSRIKQLNFGHDAAREFEDADPEFAKVLFPAFYVASQMARGLKVGNVQG